MYSLIGIWIAIGLLGLAVLATIISGIKGIATGNQEFKKIGIILIPFIVFIIAYFIADDPSRAGIITVLFMMATMILSILATGFRGTFNL